MEQDSPPPASPLSARDEPKASRSSVDPILDGDSGMAPGRARLIFAVTAIVYGVFWTFWSHYMEDNFRYDVIEMFFIGKEGVISTFKHPALNSAVLELVYRGLGRCDIAPYLLAQVCFFMTAWTVWRLGRECLSPRGALFSVLSFYGYWGYFYKSLYYNHNVVLFPAWGFIILFALLALKHGRLRYWLLLGLAIGIGVYCKLTVLVLVAAILIYSALSPPCRRYWLRPGPYLTTGVSLFLAIPLILWIVRSGFSCLEFPEYQYGLEETLGNRFYALCNDAISSFPVLISSFVLLLLPLLGLRWRFRSLDPEHRFARNFLLGMFLIPWLLQAISVFVEVIPMEYGNFMHLFLFTGPILLLSFRTDTSPVALRKFWGVFAFIMIGYVTVYSVYIYKSNFYSHRLVLYTFPGRQLAEKAESVWHDRFERPLPYVVGAWWYAGNVAIYGKDRPTVHSQNNAYDMEESFPLSNWSTDSQVNRYGGLVLWRIEVERDGRWTPVPEKLFERFPSAELVDPLRISLENRHVTNPVIVGVAVVPPDESVRAEPFKPSPGHFFPPFRN